MTTWKETGRLVEVGYDRNNDRESDSLVLYVSAETIGSIWVDEDLNGIYELQYIYSPEEKLIASYEDPKQNGFFTRYTRFTSDSLYVYDDKNMNAWFEESELLRSALR